MVPRTDRGKVQLTRTYTVVTAQVVRSASLLIVEHCCVLIVEI